MPFKWKPTENPRKKVDPGVMKAAVKCVLDDNVSIRAAAVEYEVDRKTLGRYVTKVKEGNETAFKADHNSSQIFSSEEENDLEKYLLTAARLNYGLTPKELRRFAYEYAVARGKPIGDNWKKNNQASYDWERGFMHRHPRLSLRNPQGKSLGRGTAFNPTSVGEFFQNLRSVYHTNKFGPESIYNLDETGVTNVQKPGKVIAPKGEKQVSKMTSAERGTLVTLCCAVSATGNAVPPFFVYPRQRLNDKMIDGAPVGSCAGVSPSGWMTGETFVHYWEHFIKHTKCSKERPVLVILDNHESHVTPQTLQIAKDNGITLITLPPHTSHKTQPLDRTVFGPFKTVYNQAIDDFMTTHPGETATIYQIPKFVGNAFPVSFTPANIISGFKCTGIWPFDSTIFNSTDFMSSYVTYRPSPASEDAAAISKEPHPTLITQPSCSGISPEQVRPFPKAGPKKSKNGRKRVVSRVLTDTPVKAAIEKEYEERVNRKRNQATLPSKTIRKIFPNDCEDSVSIEKERKKRRQSHFTPTADEDEASENITDDDDCEEVNNEDWGVMSAKSGDFVLVKFCTKSTACHYVGKVIQIREYECKVKFMRRYRFGSDCFVYPDVEDTSYVPFEDMKILPKPVFQDGTERMSSKLRFSVRFINLNVR